MRLSGWSICRERKNERSYFKGRTRLGRGAVEVAVAVAVAVAVGVVVVVEVEVGVAVAVVVVVVVGVVVAVAVVVGVVVGVGVAVAVGAVVGDKLNLPASRGGLFRSKAMLEFETKIELMGADRDAFVTYEIDFDGTPDIYKVEIGRVVSFYDFEKHDIGYRRKAVDITDMLDASQFGLLVEAILEAMVEAETDNRINRYELARAERLAA